MNPVKESKIQSEKIGKSTIINLIGSYENPCEKEETICYQHGFSWAQNDDASANTSRDIKIWIDFFARRLSIAICFLLIEAQTNQTKTLKWTHSCKWRLKIRSLYYDAAAGLDHDGVNFISTLCCHFFAILSSLKLLWMKVGHFKSVLFIFGMCVCVDFVFHFCCFFGSFFFLHLS